MFEFTRLAITTLGGKLSALGLDGWHALALVPVQFALRAHVPDHWRMFGARRSPLTLRKILSEPAALG
jgi:hypothetical protein